MANYLCPPRARKHRQTYTGHGYPTVLKVLANADSHFLGLAHRKPCKEGYFRQAVRFFHCQKRRHNANVCHGPQRCKVSAGLHSPKESCFKNHPQCATCGVPHAVSLVGCASNVCSMRRNELINGKNSKHHMPQPYPEAVTPASFALASSSVPL